MFVKYAVAITFLLLSNIASSQIFGPSNYDDCVTSRMKGQDIRMIAIVQRSCERDFEVPIARDKISLEWFTSSNEVTISVRRNETDFQVTRTILRFSTKDCEESESDDFNIMLEAQFESRFPFSKKIHDRASITTNQARRLKCMRTLEVFGKRYK